jgi:membrane protein implicated in regulation of membrane protease activity
MPADFASTLVVVLCFAATFIAARLLSRGFRKRRAEKQQAKLEAQRRVGETRQVRRARERQGR